MPAYKLHYRTDYQGLPISIENRKGSYRYWYDPHNDTKGKTLMKFPYGYVRGTLGTDGDSVDVYVGPDDEAPSVFVITQMKAPKFTEVDEQKCMLGFTSGKEAKAAYLAHYNNPKFFGSMKEISIDQFKEKLNKLKGKLIKGDISCYNILLETNNMTLKLEPSRSAKMRLNVMKSVSLPEDEMDLKKEESEGTKNLKDLNKALTAKVASSLMGSRGRVSTANAIAGPFIAPPPVINVVPATDFDASRVFVGKAVAVDTLSQDGSVYKSLSCGHRVPSTVSECTRCSDVHKSVKPGPYWG